MPKGKLKVQDTADVYMLYANGDVRLYGCMNTTGIQKTVSTEDIRCGIGANLLTILYTDPDMTLTFTPAVMNEWLMELQSGDTFTSGSVNVWTSETDKVGTTASADATFSITGTPVSGIVKVQDKQGKIYPATFATGTVTVTGGANKGPFDCSYQKAVTGNVLELRTDTNPEVIGVVLHTIGVDTVTNTVSTDLYFEFPRVLCDGGIDLALAIQTNSVNEVTARVLPVNGLFGKYISVDRV